MGQVLRREQLIGDYLKDSAIKTRHIGSDQVTQACMADDAIGSAELAGTAVVYKYQLKGAVVSVPKIEPLIQYGSIWNVTKTGRYQTFAVAFGAAPNVVVSLGTVVRGTYINLKKAPVVGSFRVGLSGAGTAPAWFMAMGSRA